MEIWDVGDGDIVILGSDRPWRSDTEVYGQAFKMEEPRKGLASIELVTPEAVLARRMASQRTAFAIPGPGPVQGDEFPILEYAAPRAFYMYLNHMGVFRLLKFDERTWQMDLATEKVNNDLAKLDPPALQLIFEHGQGSANIDLLTYLHIHFEHYSGRGSLRALMSGNHAMPCSLQGTNKNFGIYTPPSAATNAITRQLVMSEYSLRSAPTSQSAAIQGIENALDAVSGYRSQDADWSPAYYADLGVKASLRLSDSRRAGAILLRGLQLEPDSDQLHYLSRILLRERILQPLDIPQQAH
jgi:hypothetical protein